MHECTLTATPLKQKYGIKGLDVAKGLLEEGFHSPTVYFPLIVDEALMFEPTETESLQTLEALAEAVERIVARAETDPESLRIAPQTTPVSRVDEARAARQLVPTEDAATR
jgi:glycine dehydrogenase subunit 2